MSILNLGGPTSRPSRNPRTVKVWIGIGLIAAVLGIGSTLAANITINGGNTTEFGQGVQRTIYCGAGHDQAAKISVTPVAAFDNSAYKAGSEHPLNGSAQPNGQSARNGEDSNQVTVGKFYLGGIRVSDIPPQCSGVDFVLTVYGNNGTDIAVPLGGTVNPQMTSPTVWFVNGCGSIPDCPVAIQNGGHGAILSADRTNYLDPTPATVVSTNGSFTLTLNLNPSDRIATDSVGEITIETQNDSFGLDQYLNGGPSFTSAIKSL
jgi:hypothetical protein